MVKTLDEQIKSLQDRQAQLKARENDLVARRRERERKARTKRLIEVGAMAESAAGFEGGDERAKEHIARLVQLGSLVESLCSTDVMANYTSREDLRATVAKALELVIYKRLSTMRLRITCRCPMRPSQVWIYWKMLERARNMDLFSGSWMKPRQLWECVSCELGLIVL